MKILATAAIALCTLSSPAAAQEVAGVFSKGRTHFIVSGGTGYAFDESYFVLGLGASYYLIDGLNVGLHIESWSGADPGMTKITPSVNYVFHQVRTVKPYVGSSTGARISNAWRISIPGAAAPASTSRPRATPLSASALSTSRISTATRPPTARATARTPR